MDFSNKKLLTIPEQIAQYLKQSIIEGQLKPGEKLPSEQELANQFRVSRPTVRDALKILASSKLIVSKPGVKGGHFVAEVNIDTIVSDFSDFILTSLGLRGLSIIEIAEIRKTLEVRAAYLAALRRSDEDLQQMKKVLDSFLDHHTKGKIYDKDFEFHRYVAKASYNRMVIIVVYAIIMSLEPLFQSIDCPPSLQQELYKELTEVYDCILHQQAEEAAQKMEQHLTHFEGFFVNKLLSVHQNLK